MALDIQALISDLVKKLGADKDLLNKFKKDPIGTAKSLLGKIDIPEDALKTIIEGVKAKLNIKDASGLIAKIKGLFGKK